MPSNVLQVLEERKKEKHICARARLDNLGRTVCGMVNGTGTWHAREWSTKIRVHALRARRHMANTFFVVNKLSRFTSNQGYNHYCTLEHVTHYLLGIMENKIYYSGYPMVLEGYNDVN
jgi:hypothetical protein